MSITAWYDTWCDDLECIQWTPGGPTRAEAARQARLSGWRKEPDGWKCPDHQKKKIRS